MTDSIWGLAAIITSLICYKNIKGLVTRWGKPRWLGFLVSELAKDLDWIRVSIYSGAIWIAWHSPLILFSDYHSYTPLWFAWRA